MTREEAIQIIHNIYQTDKEKLALEFLIPELAECEDERIRRWLCDYFSSIDKAWIHKDITCIDILRWLEKQKEQKPLHWRRIEDATTQRTDDGCCVTSEKMLVKGWINDGDYRIVDEGTMVNRDILCIPVRELNAEQKSNFDIHWENGSMVCEQKEQKQEKFPPYVTGFKGHPDPAGTSDLEEAAKEYASKTLCDPDDGPSTGLAKESFIAGAEWQKEQKPAEWSEEDERIRKAILGFLNPDKGGTKYSSNAELVEWSDWLKSLRPSWKPSEEQMKALYDACCIAFEEERDFHPSLSRLYHDLRKL